MFFITKFEYHFWTGCVKTLVQTSFLEAANIHTHTYTVGKHILSSYRDGGGSASAHRYSSECYISVSGKR